MSKGLGSCVIMSSRVQFVPIRLYSVLNAFKLLMSKLIRRRYLLPEVKSIGEKSKNNVSAAFRKEVLKEKWW